MPSTFFGLNIAGSGLRAANAALNTTSNNIANAETKGYSRQAVEQQAANALRVFTTYGTAGAGVDTIAIERIRDQFYDNKYRTNQTYLGEQEQKNYYNSLVETYLTDDGKSGFNTLFSNMQAALQSVLTASGTTETKTTYIASVKQLTDYFNNLAGNLEKEQSDINSEIKLLCDNISAIARDVATINQQINVIEMQGSTANELRDRRDVLVDELSKYVDVETKEIEVVDDNDPDRKTGATRYQIFIAGGQELVDTYDYKQLVCVARDADNKVNQSDITGLYDIMWAGAKYKEGDDLSFLSSFKMDNQLIGGELQGLIEMRDGNNGSYFNGEVVKTVKNQDGSVSMTVNVSSSDLKDMNKCNLPVTGSIMVGSKYYEFTDWAYDGGSAYTFTISPESVASTTPAVGKTAKVGSYYSYQGIPYYMRQMNEFVRRLSAQVNNILSTGYTSDSLEGVYMLTGDCDTDSNAQYSLPELTSLSENKGYYSVTATNFNVNSALLDNADLLATKLDVTEGADEFLNVKKLYDMLAHDEIFRGATSGEFLDKVLGDITLNTSNSTTLEKTYNALANTIENQRLSVCGVDGDEEAVNLVKFQNSYNLASKAIQVFSEVYDRLIQQTGV